MRGAIKKCVNSWSRRWEGSEFSQIKVCFYYPWVGGGPGWGFQGNYGFPFTIWHFFMALLYLSHVFENALLFSMWSFRKKTLHSNYGFIILISSGIFWAIKRSKLELPQINRKFNFAQFNALNQIRSDQIRSDQIRSDQII